MISTIETNNIGKRTWDARVIQRHPIKVWVGVAVGDPREDDDKILSSSSPALVGRGTHLSSLFSFPAPRQLLVVCTPRCPRCRFRRHVQMGRFGGSVKRGGRGYGPRQQRL